MIKSPEDLIYLIASNVVDNIYVISIILIVIEFLVLILCVPSIMYPKNITDENYKVTGELLYSQRKEKFTLKILLDFVPFILLSLPIQLVVSHAAITSNESEILKSLTAFLYVVIFGSYVLQHAQLAFIGKSQKNDVEWLNKSLNNVQMKHPQYSLGDIGENTPKEAREFINEKRDRDRFAEYCISQTKFYKGPLVSAFMMYVIVSLACILLVVLR